MVGGMSETVKHEEVDRCVMIISLENFSGQKNFVEGPGRIRSYKDHKVVRIIKWRGEKVMRVEPRTGPATPIFLGGGPRLTRLI
jgi:hypothetical protein